MPFWSPKRRKYWGYKQNGSSDSTELEESDSSSSDYTPMPWEPQDSAEDNTMYWKGEDSAETYFENRPARPTAVFTSDEPAPIWPKGSSLVELIRKKPPEDLDPKKYVENLLNRVNSKTIAVQDNVITKVVSLEGLNYAPGLLDNFHITNFAKTIIPGTDPEPWYGSFVGPGPDKPVHLTGKMAINEIDLAASRHDDVYFMKRATGVSDAVFNLEVLDADKKLVDDAERIIWMFKIKEIDSITLKPVNFETYLMAKAVKQVFSKIVAEKENGFLPKAYNAMNDPKGLMLHAIINVVEVLKADFKSYGKSNANSRWFE